MSELGTELTLSEMPAVHLLERLGYSYLPPEAIAPLREGPRNTILIKPLEDALRRLNSWLSEDNLAKAVRAVTKPAAATLMEANEAVHTLITRGGTVQQDLGNGMTSHVVRYIDFEDPSRNTYQVTRQFPVKGLEAGIELDVAVFVNGLMLGVIESKSPFIEKPIEHAVEQLERFQELGDRWRGRGAAQAFHAAQILIGACREQAVFGSVCSPARFYAPFPEAYPTPAPPLAELLGRDPTPQDILIYSLLRPDSLLEYTRNLVAFEVEKGQTIKKLARHQQRIAIAETINRLLQGNLSGRGGSIWHTQGSGKSLTMGWLAQKLRQTSLGLGNPTLAVVTDRTDLDDQITGTFQRVGLPNPVQAKSVAHLRELLRAGGGVTILTTVQKFYDATGGTDAINKGTDIYVMVDEAHRTQYSSLAARMRAALPNATFIGFTGTPIDKKARSTNQTFGPYIHKYTIAESVRDGATVPILYEARDLERFGVEGRRLDALFDRYFGGRTAEECERIKQKYATQESLAGAPQRIKEIALDIVQHYEQHIAPNGFKAQIVAVNRETAVRYKQELDALDAPESVIIYTTSNDDEADLAEHHTSKAERKALIKRFKDPKDPLKIIIVVDMLLTGFDAPVEQVLYLDAPLKEHTLLQAIARVNRTAENKTYGLIVDYWGVSAFLKDALASFDENELGDPMRPHVEELPRLETRHQAAIRFFAGIARDDYDALLKVIEPEDRRALFDQSFRAFAKSLDVLYPDPRALPFEADFKWLGRIREAARQRFRAPELDWSDIANKVRQLIHDNVQASGVVQLCEPVSILSAEFEQHVEGLASPEAKASEIAHAIRHEIKERAQENPVFYASLKERLEQIIQARREERLSAVEQLKLLLPLANELREGAASSAKALGLTDTSYAFYQLLEQGGVEQHARIPLASEIETSLDTLAVIDWTTKEDVKREMRRALRRSLLKRGMDRDAAEPVVTQLLSVAMARMPR